MALSVVRVLDYYDRILQAIYRQIELQMWSIENFYAKAKSTISTGAVVLSITTVAMVGFAALLPRGALDPPAILEPVFGALAAPAICLAVGGIGSIIGSMVVSIRSLRGRPIEQILSSGEFKIVPKSGNGNPPEGTRAMSSDELGDRLQRNAVGAMRTLEEYIDWISPRVHAGQMLLLIGIGLMSAVPAVALLWTLFLRAPV